MDLVEGNLGFPCDISTDILSMLSHVKSIQVTPMLCPNRKVKKR
jgi:hypothetical protein